MKPFEKLAFEFSQDSQLVILTGAGISAESGLKTFRGAGGLWEGYRVEEVATPEAYDRHPELVVRFYNERRKQLMEVKPNPAHQAIARLQAALGDRCFLVTQNVDDLHERGGAEQVCHMHGELMSLKCTSQPNLRYRLHQEHEHFQQSVTASCPECSPGLLRPDIVWFGEMPYHMDQIETKLVNCTHFIYSGTSSQVYPAAGFKDAAKRMGAKVLCINLEVDQSDPATDFFLEGAAGELWPGFVQQLLG